MPLPADEDDEDVAASSYTRGGLIHRGAARTGDDVPVLMDDGEYLVDPGSTGDVDVGHEAGTWRTAGGVG
ncbi:hypothetical protein ACIP98_29010 [Streptomyces sp. NPDC088354]|uniref:hypothetical protein n=1 Tax=Streptomyces sp. NPDC088354 TaxID=3365856 RepID=UPI00382A2218